MSRSCWFDSQELYFGFKNNCSLFSATGVDLFKILGGTRSGQSAITDDIIGVSGATSYIIHWCIFFTVLYISLATISLAVKLKIFAFLQHPVLKPIFSATWVVLILALKNQCLKRDDF